MKATLLKMLLFFGLNALLLLFGLMLVRLIEPKFVRTNSTTEATFSTIPKNETFDFVIIGTSRAREFSRSGNHAVVEKLTGKKFFNLSKGGGHGGLIPNIMAWNYLKQRGNKTKHVIYFIDSWIFYSPKWNEENYCLEDEPFTFDILKLAISSSLSTGSIINYFKSKLKPSYLFANEISQNANNKYLVTADSFLINKQNKASFPDGLNQEYFNKYSADFKRFISRIREDGIKITFVLPPTLLYNEPGYGALLDVLHTINNVKLFDHRRSMTDPQYYYDHPHINSRGIQKYVAENPEIFE